MESREGNGVDSLSALAAMAAEERTGSRRMRLALAAAVGVHLVLFAVHWPTFASGVAEAEVEKPKIFVLRIHRVVPPEERPFEVPPLPQKKVSIPDATPDDPEPLPERELVPTVDFSDVPEVDLWREVEPPPTPQPEPKIWRVGGPVSAPVKVSGADPVYPEVARKVGREGVVILECLVDRAGRVREVSVLKGEPLGLTEAAVEAVRGWSFKPADMEGQPVDVLYILTVRFSLQR